MMVIRNSQAASGGAPDKTAAGDPLQELVAEVFAEQLAVDRVPLVRAICRRGERRRAVLTWARLRVGAAQFIRVSSPVTALTVRQIGPVIGWPAS
jgi:hypothetical protein